MRARAGVRESERAQRESFVGSGQSAAKWCVLCSSAVLALAGSVLVCAQQGDRVVSRQPQTKVRRDFERGTPEFSLVMKALGPFGDSLSNSAQKLRPRLACNDKDNSKHKQPLA